MVLLGSGGLVHNLSAVNWQSANAGRIHWAGEFANWIDDRLREGNIEYLLAWEALAPHARRAHPTHEHLLPFFVALGYAGQPLRSQRIHQATELESLVMDAFQFN